LAISRLVWADGWPIKNYRWQKDHSAIEFFDTILSDGTHLAGSVKFVVGGYLFVATPSLSIVGLRD